jgi:short-subunit dehydrogenase
VTALPLVPVEGQSLSPLQATKTLSVNALSHFTTLSIVLPYLLSSPNGAHIVTISSILAHLSPSKLADYSSSKAAISALHNTIFYELLTHPDPKAFSRVKTLLVEPGMLATQLFSDITKIPWYAHFFDPVLEVKDVAKEIVKQIERGEGGVIRLPFYAKCVPLLSVMPGTLQRLARWWSGIDRAIVARPQKS